VEGWPQKALVGTFLGRLRADIANSVKMFKPWTLRETIQFARMQEDQMIGPNHFSKGKNHNLLQEPNLREDHHRPPLQNPIKQYRQSRRFRGRKCKSRGRKDCVSVAMKDSHQAIGVLSNNCLYLMLRLGLIMTVQGNQQ
jgi:hypothetical protein